MKYQQLDRNPCKHLWTKEEDQILLQVVGTGEIGKWAVIAADFNLRVSHLNPEDSERSSIPRTNKQCQERWQNHVNPELQNSLPWSQEEHCLLFTLFKQYCHQWSKIGEKLVEGGFARRGGTNIKNYFYATIKKAMKQINAYIREHNLNSKKRKSQLYRYAEKYVYKKRLSLEREIMEGSSDCGRSNNYKTETDVPQEEELRIVKELDHAIINKILLLAEWKGENKFVISQEEDHQYACALRNSLVDFVKDQTTFNGAQAVTLASNILQISKKCKRKTNQQKINAPKSSRSKKLLRRQHQQAEQQKTGQVQELKEIDIEDMNEEIMDESFNEEQILEMIMQKDENNPTKTALVDRPDERINSLNVYSYNANAEPCRLAFEQSSEFIYNSNSLEQRYERLPSPGIDSIQFQKIREGRSPLIFESLNYQAQLHKSLEPRDISEEHIFENEDGCSNMAQLNFLSTFREFTPRDSQITSQALDFDFDYVTSNFLHQDRLDKPINEYDRPAFLSTNNLRLPWDSAEHFREHQLKNREFQKNEQPASEMFSSQPFRHSWAHTSSPNDGHKNLFNSHYRQSKPEESSSKPKRNNFRPFYRQ